MYMEPLGQAIARPLSLHEASAGRTQCPFEGLSKKNGQTLRKELFQRPGAYFR